MLRKHEKSLRALYETYAYGEGGIIPKGSLLSTKLLSVVGRHSTQPKSQSQAQLQAHSKAMLQPRACRCCALDLPCMQGHPCMHGR